jgi:hypothetical protein
VKLRKLIMGAAAVALPLGVMSTVVGTGAAVAAAKVQPGTLNCTHIAGTVTFNPPLSNTAQTVTTTIKVKETNCTPSGGGLKPKSGAANAVQTTANDSCAGLGSGSTTPETLKVKWAPALKIKPTTITFSGFDAATNGAGDAGFSLPNSGGSASGTGSYLDSDGGASSTAQAFTNKTAAQIAAQCTTGISSLTIASGTSHLG